MTYAMGFLVKERGEPRPAAFLYIKPNGRFSVLSVSMDKKTIRQLKTRLTLARLTLALAGRSHLTDAEMMQLGRDGISRAELVLHNQESRIDLGYLKRLTKEAVPLRITDGSILTVVGVEGPRQISA